MREPWEIRRMTSVDWRPSKVVALAVSVDQSTVAAAREDGSVEIWLAAPGSVGWHCQLTIDGNSGLGISSLVWCYAGPEGPATGRLFSSSLDGSISEWDLFSLRRESVLDSIGISIWQIAAEPLAGLNILDESSNGVVHDSDDGVVVDEDETDEDSAGEACSNAVFSRSKRVSTEVQRLALACDDGRVRLCSISDSERLTSPVSLPGVEGRILSVAWSFDSKLIFAGSSNGFIRCWNVDSAREVYRITVGFDQQELFLWSLLVLRNDTLVSADSTGSVHFWDTRQGTLITSFSDHEGDVYALAAAPSHRRVFSAGSDRKVIQYVLSASTCSSPGDYFRNDLLEKWTSVHFREDHTNDIHALVVAVPISTEDSLPDEMPKRIRKHKKPVQFSYRKWAHSGVPMLISGGDDSKLFAYPVNQFSKFDPHDICPAPQRLPVHMVSDTLFNTDLVLVQCPDRLDVTSVCIRSNTKLGKRKPPGSRVINTHIFGAKPVVRVLCKKSERIICSAISRTGELVAFSDHVKPTLFELKRLRGAGDSWDWVVEKKRLPHKLPFAHCMAFSSDSSCLIVAGHDRKIYVVDILKLEVIQMFTPCRNPDFTSSEPEPPITKMFTSSDGQWLSAVNSYGDIYIFNVELSRQHWFISRLQGASVTAGGFLPGKSCIFIFTTSANSIFVFDVDAKELGEWSKRHSSALPRQFQEFPGEVIGLAFPPSTKSTSVIVYSSRAMCSIDFGMPVDNAADNNVTGAPDKEVGRKVHENGFRKRVDAPVNSVLKKRKTNSPNMDQNPPAGNFVFDSFRDLTMFVGFLSDGSLLTVGKPWREVAQTFGPPLHRHIYGN